MLEFVFSFSVSVEMITQFVSFSLLGPVNFIMECSSRRLLQLAQCSAVAQKQAMGLAFTQRMEFANPCSIP